MPRGSLALVVPLSGLPLPIILFSAWVPLSDPDGTSDLFVLIPFFERAVTPIICCLVTVAHVPPSPLVVPLIVLRSLLAALTILLSAPPITLSILLVLLRLTTLQLVALLSTLIPLLIELILVH